MPLHTSAVHCHLICLSAELDAPDDAPVLACLLVSAPKPPEAIATAPRFAKHFRPKVALPVISDYERHRVHRRDTRQHRWQVCSLTDRETSVQFVPMLGNGV